MTGTGTQADPYIISENDTPSQIWNDFITAISTSGAYVQCPENYVLDMNKLYPAGYEGYTTWRAKYTYGNGFTIYNLYCKSTPFGLCANGGTNIQEVNFRNFIFDGTSMFGGSPNNDYTYIRKCRFVGKMLSGSMFDAGNNIVFEPVQNQEHSGNLFQVDFADGTAFHKSVYLMRHNFSVFNFSGSSASSNYGITCNNCMFTGKIPFSSLTLSGKYTIIDAEMNGTVSVSSMTASFYNSDKAQISVSGNGLNPATGEQLRSAEFLESYGFPIGVDG